MDNNIIGNNISYLRRQKGLTQQELSAHINYSDKVISKWERGECLPDINALKSIEEYFQVPLEQIVRSKMGNEPEKVSDNQEKAAKSRAPLVFFQIIMLFFALAMCSRIIAIIFNIGGYYLNFKPDWTMIMTAVFSGLFAVAAIIDVILVNLKVNRIANIIVFFILAVLSLLALIVTNLLYGPTDEDIIVNPILKQGFACLGVFIIGYLIEPIFKSPQTESYLKKSYSPVFGAVALILFVVVIISLAFPFYRMKYIVNQEAIDNSTNLVFPFFNYDYFNDFFYNELPGGDLVPNPHIMIPPTTHSFYNILKGNALFIITLVLLITAAIWDIFSLIFHSWYKQKGNAFKKLSAKASGITTLITSCLFFIFYVSSQMVLSKSDANTQFLRIEVDGLWGVYVASVVALVLTVMKIIMSVQLITDRPDK